MVSHTSLSRVWLERAAAAHPSRIAIEAPDGALTYSELLQRAGAAWPEPFVAAASSLEFSVALHARLLGRVPIVPLDPRLSDGERERRRAVAASLGETSDVAVVLFTSGTTSAPRPVELTYDNWEANARGSAQALGLDPGERWLCALPLAHVGGLSILIRSVIYGTTAVLHERFDAERVTRALGEDGITMVSLVPTMLSRLLDAGLEHPRDLRWALLGGAAAAPALLERARHAGVPVAETYGLTEACSQAVTHGRPLDGIELRIAGDGEILVAGPAVARGALTTDGWLHTGDLGAFDERGRLTVTGRKAETVVSGGENIAPTEVEAALLAHPHVADAGVYGRPDPEWGEVVVATVVLRSGVAVTEDDLRKHCGENLARFKVPKAIEFADSLPRTPSGKLLRRALAD